SATLTIYDITGKVLRSVKGDYKRGYNEIKINKTSLGNTSVMYYQLQSGHFSETRKMIMMR
ncbi:MAG: hypothetical protein OEM26_04225, partial [Saprospiraceae bacterium]|nr:hypothetical protein [Saprospiraceae bacterium]